MYELIMIDCAPTFAKMARLGHFCHFAESGIDALASFSQHLYQIAGVLHVVRGEEGIGRAHLSLPPRAPNAVDIVLGRGWVVEIYHVPHVVYVCESITHYHASGIITYFIHQYGSALYRIL